MIEMAEAEEIFGDDRPDARVKEIRQWLKSKGVLDFEAVSLFCDQLDQVSLRAVMYHCTVTDLPRSAGHCGRDRHTR